MNIQPFFRLMEKHDASDLFLIPGAAPKLKVKSRAIAIGDKPLDGALVHAAARALMDERQLLEFEETWECNFGVAIEGIGRFRVNVFRQRGQTAMVVRFIKSKIPSIEELNLPPVLEQLATQSRGLILVVGATGSGKSTTLASMIDYRNQLKDGHILTIEDPIEYLHKHRQCVVSQREVGIDTQSYEAALKNAMREAPDLIMIGEIRDERTMRHAISYAETGHLCLSTLHANNANQALDRITSFFPDSARHQTLMDLSLNLKAVVSQRMIRDTKGELLPAVEVMLQSKYISELIRKGEFGEIKDAMQKSNLDGIQTFDQALFELHQRGRITRELALENADSPNDLSLNMRLIA